MFLFLHIFLLVVFYLKREHIKIEKVKITSCVDAGIFHDLFRRMGGKCFHWC